LMPAIATLFALMLWRAESGSAGLGAGIDLQTHLAHAPGIGDDRDDAAVLLLDHAGDHGRAAVEDPVEAPSLAGDLGGGRVPGDVTRAAVKPNVDPLYPAGEYHPSQHARPAVIAHVIMWSVQEFRT